MKKYHDEIIQQLKLELNKQNINYIIEYHSVHGEFFNYEYKLHFMYDVLIFDNITLAKFVTVCGIILQFSSNVNFNQGGIEIFLIKNVNEKVFEEYQDKFYD